MTSSYEGLVFFIKYFKYFFNYLFTKWSERDIIGVVRERSGGISMFFIGTYNHSLDEKSRVIMPSKLREQLGARVYINLGLDKCLAVYPVETFENIVAKMSSQNSNDPKVRFFKRTFFASSYLCEIDKQGRIQLTKESLEKCGITKDVVIIGADDKIEIWDRERYKAFELENESAYEENAANLIFGE